MVQNVVIIGAGPAGLLLAHYLLRRGNYHIEIYERRPDSRLTDVSGNRTFPLSLQERGRKAIRAIVGLEEAIAAQSVFCHGTIIYRKKGKSRPIPRQNPVLTIDYLSEKGQIPADSSPKSGSHNRSQSPRDDSVEAI